MLNLTPDRAKEYEKTFVVNDKHAATEITTVIS